MPSRLLPPLAVAALVLLAAPGIAPMYVKIEGIDGEATAVGHEGWIEIHGFQAGATAGAARATGGPAGPAVFHDLVVHKQVDKATPMLFEALATGAAMPELTFSLVPGTAQGHDMFFDIVITDAHVVSVLAAGTAEDRPTEQVTFNFAKIQMVYRPARADGSAGPAVSFGWDIQANRRV